MPQLEPIGPIIDPQWEKIGDEHELSLHIVYYLPKDVKFILVDNKGKPIKSGIATLKTEDDHPPIEVGADVFYKIRPTDSDDTEYEYKKIKVQQKVKGKYKNYRTKKFTPILLHVYDYDEWKKHKEKPYVKAEVIYRKNKAYINADDLKHVIHPENNPIADTHIRGHISTVIVGGG